jgi:hypothetical protein
VSLGSVARLRFRPWPYRDGDALTSTSTPTRPAHRAGEDLTPRRVTLELAPRSAYLMRGVARWGWQHSLAPVDALRYSITMRTARVAPSRWNRRPDVVRVDDAPD